MPATTATLLQPGAPQSGDPMLTAPILPLLVRQALPTVSVMFLVTLLSVAETYFVASLGTDAIAAASLVLPVQLLMTMVSNGGIGGGVSASIARALGAGRRDLAESLAWHACVIALAAGALFTVCLWWGGPTLFAALGGHGDALRQAVLYSNVLFGGAVLSWLLMLLQAALRGSGNPGLPARVVALSVGVGLSLSPALILGWAGLPRLGIVGAGVAQVITNALAVTIVVRAMRRDGTTLRLRPAPLDAASFTAILRIGLPSSINAAMANLALTALTAAAGVFGTAALAGYGIASRLDMLLVPLLFGFGTATLTVVGYNLGAGQVQRARRVAVLNALAVAGVLEVLGLLVAWQPQLWLQWFTGDAAVLASGGDYLRRAAPAYGGVALAMELYFAGQGAGRIGWPLVATALRLLVAITAAVLAARGMVDLRGAALMAAGGMAGAGLLSLWGFTRTDWRARNRQARPLLPVIDTRLAPPKPTPGSSKPPEAPGR